jgi:hypothetical protein
MAVGISSTLAATAHRRFAADIESAFAHHNSDEKRKGNGVASKYFIFEAAVREWGGFGGLDEVLRRADWPVAAPGYESGKGLAPVTALQDAGARIREGGGESAGVLCGRLLHWASRSDSSWQFSSHGRFPVARALCPGCTRCGWCLPPLSVRPGADTTHTPALHFSAMTLMTALRTSRRPREEPTQSPAGSDP